MKRTCLSLLALFMLLCPRPVHAQDPEAANAFGTPESLVRLLYETVTFEAGDPPDWDLVRKTFLPEAVIILRSSRTGTTQHDVDGFIADFVAFIDGSNLADVGFTERIVDLHATEYGVIAHVEVLYEASVPGSDRPPQQGVDFWQLAKKDGRWWIVSVLNEIPMIAGPPPAGLGQIDP